MDIKDTLKQRRIELNLTMADVAKAVGVSEATVSRWESGNISNMKRNRIVALSNILQINPSVIMGWEDTDQDISPIPSLTETESYWLDLFRQIPDEKKDTVIQMLQALLPPK